MKLLVINPGSTSTKIAVYENEVPRLVRSIRHTVDELSSFSHIIDQFEFRKNLVQKELEAKGLSGDEEQWKTLFTLLEEITSE